MVSRYLLLIGSALAAQRYNILSLDSARYKGLMTSKMIDYMEMKAYQTAIRDNCMTAR
jgi:hypothetical protein